MLQFLCEYVAALELEVEDFVAQSLHNHDNLCWNLGPSFKNILDPAVFVWAK